MIFLTEFGAIYYVIVMRHFSDYSNAWGLGGCQHPCSKAPKASANSSAGNHMDGRTDGSIDAHDAGDGRLAG